MAHSDILKLLLLTLELTGATIEDGRENLS